jgi:hypothetical protein
MPNTVRLQNPFTNVGVDFDLDAVTQAQLDYTATFMDDDLRERLNSELAPCSPAEFLTAWIKEVGTEEASRVLLT